MEKNAVDECGRSPSRFRGLQLILVQSSVCVLVVVTTLLLRVLGVDAYGEICSLFQRAMTSEVLVSASSTPTSQSDTSCTETVASFVDTDVASSTVTQKFVAPLHNATLTSSFGERDDPFGAGEHGIHQGMDLAAPEGTPLFALTDGKVKLTDYEENGFGQYIVVSCDNGFRYLYAHCSAIYVQAGQSVKAGDTLAAVGNTGRSTGSHVHIEWIADDGTKMDPSAVIPREAYD